MSTYNNRIYEYLDDIEDRGRAGLDSAHNAIEKEILGLLRDDDRTGVLQKYLDEMLKIYLDTLDEQIRWSNNPEDTNGEVKILYASREGYLKYLLDVLADVKQIGHVAIERDFIYRWQKVISPMGNKIPQECFKTLGLDVVAIYDQSQLVDSCGMSAIIPEALRGEEAQSIIKRAVEAGLCKKESNGKYVWLKTMALFGYFIDKLGDIIDGIKTTGGRIQWKIVCPYFNIDNKGQITARQAINNYKNKSLSPPEGDDIVDGVIKG